MVSSPLLLRRFEMQSYSARCDKDQTLLFEVPNFEAFHKPSPVIIACRGGCGRKFTVRPTEEGGISVSPYGRKGKKLVVLEAEAGEA